ncbi:MAG TPA: SAV_6107 family HEPN domain-containing protein [Pseudonocardia sp.]|nr:SAV_6107 family HEPN domain-containing protein [Pseudonocardia sp.]
MTATLPMDLPLTLPMTLPRARPVTRSMTVPAARRPGNPPARPSVPSGVPGSSGPSRRTVPVGPPPSAAALGLLRQAEEGLAEAEQLVDPSRRYATAHLAALRAGAAVLAVRAQPAKPRRGARSVWQLLTLVAPELTEWAAFFAAGSATRAAAEAGITRLVTERAADDLVRQVGQFLEVTRSLVSR